MPIISYLTVYNNRDHYHGLHLKHEHIIQDLEHYSQNVWGRKEKEEDNVVDIADFDNDPNNLRLPLEVIPYHYYLRINPILEQGMELGKQWTAPGNVKILVKAAKPERTITLHSVELNITNVQVSI